MLKTFKTFYQFLLKRKWVFALSMLFTTLFAVTKLIAPYFFKLFVDRLIAGNFEGLKNLILIFIGTQFAGLIFANLRYYLGDIVAVDASIDIRSTIFKHVQDLDFAFHTGKSTGSLISAFKRGDNAFWGLFDRLNRNLYEILVGFVIMAYFFLQIDYRFIIIFAISFVLTLIATKYLAGMNIRTREEFNDWEDKISAIITDDLINYETVKLFAQEKRELLRLKNTFVDWKKFLWKHFYTYRYIDMSVGSLINIAIFLVMSFSLNLVGTRQISIGDFILVAAFVNMFFPQLFELIYGLREITTAYADIKKYFDLLDNDITVPDPVNPVKVDHIYGEIRFIGVNFSYRNEAPLANASGIFSPASSGAKSLRSENTSLTHGLTPKVFAKGDKTKNAINDFDLKIEQGQSVALVGRSGSGKTTLGKLLMRFYDVDSGEISIDGINIKDFTKDTLRNFIGAVPQEPILFNNTVAYNIAYGKPEVSIKEIREASKIANIDDFIQSLPEKYETEVGERGVKLSGGQKQRLAIARMILSDPDIVVFDEATSHLDSESEKLIQDAFWKARRGKTTIIIAHRLSTVMRADKIVVMEHGKIKEIGTHEGLLKDKKSLYSHFWNLQIKLD